MFFNTINGIEHPMPDKKREGKRRIFTFVEIF